MSSSVWEEVRYARDRSRAFRLSSRLWPMALHRDDIQELSRLAIAPVYARPRAAIGIPKDALPDDGMDPRVAYRLIHDELMLDGNSRQNVATFVTTFMDEEADRLFAETADKNMIDKDEYPQTAEIESRRS